VLVFYKSMINNKHMKIALEFLRKRRFYMKLTVNWKMS